MKVRVRGKDIRFTPQMATMARMDQVEGRNKEHLPDLFCGRQGLQDLGHHLLDSQAVSRKPD